MRSPHGPSRRRAPVESLFRIGSPERKENHRDEDLQRDPRRLINRTKFHSLLGKEIALSQPDNRAGSPVIAPPLRFDDSTVAVAQANANALNDTWQAALRNDGIVQLPAGTIYIADSRPDTGELTDR